MTLNIGNLELALAQKTSGQVPASVTKGEHTYTSPGTYLFTPPNGVTSISVLVVGGGGSGGKGTNAAGGGGLAYLNNKTVIPGQPYTIVVGEGGAATTGAGTRNQAGVDGGDSSAFGVTAGGGKGGQQGTPAYGTDGVFGGGGLGGVPSGVYTVGRTGGRGGGHSGVGDNAGGGSAAGYSSNGKNGASAYRTNAGVAGAGGSGGSGAGTNSTTYDYGGSGGGVGIYGEGSNGTAGQSNASSLSDAHGTAGSGGSGVTYGGGTGSSWENNSLKGGDGAVRIIYGTGRSWPSTLTSQAESDGNVVTNGVSSSSSSPDSVSGLDLLTAHKALSYFKTNEVNYVETVSDLPTASENLGKIYFVASEDTAFWANETLGWANLQTTEAKNIYGVGEDYYGQLGTGNWGQADKFVPTPLCVSDGVGGDSNDWVYLNSGKCHSVGMKAAGTLHFWGNGPNGRQTQSSLQPYACCAHYICGSSSCVQTYVCGIAGNCRTVGLGTDGTIWTWGYTGNGSGGDNTGNNNNAAGVQEISSSTNWCHVSTGWYAGSHGIKTDGTFWSWGADSYGLMGRNTNSINASSPVQEITSSTNWCTGDYGFYSNGGIKTDGTMWGWGTGFYGVSFTAGITSSSPVQELLSATNWCKMAYTGGNQPYSGIGLKTDGTIWNWGCNGNGTLGIGTTTPNNTSTPTQEITSSTTWCGIAAGSESGRGIKTDGTIWSWGKQFVGEFSQSCTNVLSNRCYSSPVQEQTSGTDWCMVSAGGDYNNGFTQMIKLTSL